MTEPTPQLTRESKDHIEVGEVAEASLARAELAELVAWREAILTATTAVFFGVPLLIASAQITASYLLTANFPSQTEKAWLELSVLHWGATVVTCMGVISAILIVATSLVRVWRNFRATLRER